MHAFIWVDDINIVSHEPIPKIVQEKLKAIIRKYKFMPHHRPGKCDYFSVETGRFPILLGINIFTGTLAPKTVRRFRSKLNWLLKQNTWGVKQLQTAAGIVAYLDQIYPSTGRRRKRLPSALRVLVPRTRARIKAERAGDPVTINITEVVEELLAEKEEKNGQTGRKIIDTIVHDASATGDPDHDIEIRIALAQEALAEAS